MSFSEADRVQLATYNSLTPCRGAWDGRLLQYSLGFRRATHELALQCGYFFFEPFAGAAAPKPLAAGFGLEPPLLAAAAARLLACEAACEASVGA